MKTTWNTIFNASDELMEEFNAYRITYEFKRGGVAFNAFELFPLKKDDCKRLVSMVEMSAEPIKHAERLYSFCIEMLKSLYKFSSGHMLEDKTFTAIAKRFINNANVFAEIGGFETVTTENITLFVDGTQTGNAEEVGKPAAAEEVATNEDEKAVKGYSITPAGTVVVFYANGTRKRFDVTRKNYQEMFQAAMDFKKQKDAAEIFQASDPDPEPMNAPETVEPATLEEAAGPAEEPAEKKVVPEKTFIGTAITGKGWKIIFSAETERTQIIFAADPVPAARELLEEERFFYSGKMKSWNKKLTFKAYRAAQRVATKLEKIYAA